VSAATARLDEFTWRLDEIAEAFDRPLASFYAMLDDIDRRIFTLGHIDINGDLRIPSDMLSIL